MDKNDKDLEHMIKSKLDRETPAKAIDIRQETMARIKTYARKKAGQRDIVIPWIISILTFFTALVSLYIFEILFTIYEVYFLKFGLDALTTKFIFQGFFSLIIIFCLTAMISKKRTLGDVPQRDTL